MTSSRVNTPQAAVLEPPGLDGTGPAGCEIGFSTDAYGRLIDFGPAGLLLFGYSVQDLREGLTLPQLIDPAERNTFQKSLHGLRQGAFLGLRIYQARHRDGASFPVALFCHGEDFKDGRPKRLDGFIIDLRNLPELGALLVQTEQHQQASLRLMPSGMFYVDLERRIRSWNRAAVEITGLPGSAVIGRSCHEVLHCHGLEDVCPLQLTNVSTPIMNQLCTFSINGRTVPTLKNFDFVHNAEGRVVGGVECFVDLTRQREAETALREAEQLVRSAQQAKSEFMANMSHEIRTPMNGIMGILDLLLDSGLAPAHQEYVLLARHAAGNLMRLVNDLLDFSVLEKGALEFEKSGFSLHNIIDSVIDYHRQQVDKTQVQLTCRIAEDLPDSLMGDPGRLYQILNNLLGNAVKFTRRGHVTLGVSKAGNESTPATTPEKMTLLFRIEDSGIGIPKSKLVHIFKTFAQADGSITRSFGGLGLGLKIARRLINLQGGQLWIDSIEGSGTTVSFFMPFKVAALCAMENIPLPRRDGYENDRTMRDQGVAAPISAPAADVTEANPERCTAGETPPASHLSGTELADGLAALPALLMQGGPHAEAQIVQLRNRAKAAGREDLEVALFRMLLAVRKDDIQKSSALLKTLSPAGSSPAVNGAVQECGEEKKEK